eukprot:11194802-Lingulodinium_polyedra.AAC.1
MCWRTSDWAGSVPLDEALSCCERPDSPMSLPGSPSRRPMDISLDPRSAPTFVDGHPGNHA